jgi:hypothetical protein
LPATPSRDERYLSRSAKRTNAGELGADRRLGQLVLDRDHEALNGDLRMNCDPCAYRTPLPGYEGRVGRVSRVVGPAELTAAGT